MQVLVVGTGKLATELLGSHRLAPATCRVMAWSDPARGNVRSIVVHAGSGRELPAAIEFCRATGSPLVELSTGSDLETASHDFPVVLCPNTNILMLKFMSMLETSGHLFRDCHISVTESHQASKTSVPGTAVGVAQSLGVPAQDIHSVRDPAEQRDALQIPDDQLSRHAFHRIRIEDGACSLQFESRVYGASPYADGVSRIVEAVRQHELEPRRYSIVEFIHNGWL
ncbi:dihydrodipicolinate reductase [Burkholderia sp. FL-7-2-10-S1-D7]|uniref:dihydrodipicolinate reductase C-terminal domain-containing protein n=1 Tax=Burkholderia sp. FL-7-2-10-S1-D7 TaxID=1637866 RepID=UPI000757964B|nr:dihydrodipicolinate reductase C-terminal domain-containing protein [Burkholderia sp. FL-7-2-10-S1-D7]KVF68523.1 dihydrodipicolinate reductase [Burkholderia sp. FL-7-2-10-S1-D7]